MLLSIEEKIFPKIVFIVLIIKLTISAWVKEELFIISPPD
jgi:hypothetical protein